MWFVRRVGDSGWGTIEVMDTETRWAAKEDDTTRYRQC